MILHAGTIATAIVNSNLYMGILLGYWCWLIFQWPNIRQNLFDAFIIFIPDLDLMRINRTS